MVYYLWRLSRIPSLQSRFNQGVGPVGGMSTTGQLKRVNKDHVNNDRLPTRLQYDLTVVNRISTVPVTVGNRLY
jgi:hypothetical protein